MQWFYAKNGKQEGPVVNADFPTLIANGEITDDTLVWNETMKDWTRYADIPKPLAMDAVVTGSTCSMCGKDFSDDELIQFESSLICANCKPNFVQQIKENSEISGIAVMRYAGFWRRFGAVFIDGVITGLATLPLNLGFQAAMGTYGTKSRSVALAVVLYLFMLLIPALYRILMNGKYGATLGKKAVGIHIVMSDGSPISYGRATGRYFAEILSAIILYIGYIMAGFDDEKRALHDHICNTRVIYK